MPLTQVRVESVYVRGRSMAPTAPKPVLTSDLWTPLGHAVQVVTLNRPGRRNSLDGETLRLLSGAVTGARDRFLLLRASPPTFCAGMDLFYLREANRVPGGIQQAITGWLSILEEIQRHPKPTIAFIDGAVIGGGLGLALAFDLIYATPRSEFCLPGGALQPLARLIYPLLRRRQVLGWDGMRIGAKEAEYLGIINSTRSVMSGPADAPLFVESVIQELDVEGLVRSRPPFDWVEMSALLKDAFQPETEKLIDRFLDEWVAEQAARLDVERYR